MIEGDGKSDNEPLRIPVGETQAEVTPERTDMQYAMWHTQLDKQKGLCESEIEVLRKQVLANNLRILSLEKQIQRFIDVQMGAEIAESRGMRVTYFLEGQALCYEAEEKGEMGFRKPDVTCANTWLEATKKREEARDDRDES